MSRRKLGGEEVLSTSELADVLGLHEVTLRKWRQLGIGPAFVKLSGRVVYRESAVASWMDERTQQSTAENPVRS